MKRRRKRCVDCDKSLSGRGYVVSSEDGRCKDSMGRKGLVCRPCIAARYYHWTLGHDEMMLYLHREMWLPSTVNYQLYLRDLGRDRTEQLYWRELKAKNITKHGNRNKWDRQKWTWPAVNFFAVDALSSFKFFCCHRNGDHNWWFCKRMDLWFGDWHGQEWWGRWLGNEYGRSTQNGMTFLSNDIIRCKKTKQRGATRPPPNRISSSIISAA